MVLWVLYLWSVFDTHWFWVLMVFWVLYLWSVLWYPLVLSFDGFVGFVLVECV